jgi:hypothetical protein
MMTPILTPLRPARPEDAARDSEIGRLQAEVFRVMEVTTPDHHALRDLERRQTDLERQAMPNGPDADWVAVAAARMALGFWPSYITMARRQVERGDETLTASKRRVNEVWADYVRLREFVEQADKGTRSYLSQDDQDAARRRDLPREPTMAQLRATLVSLVGAES